MDLSFSQRLTVRTSLLKKRPISFHESRRRFGVSAGGFVCSICSNVRKCPHTSAHAYCPEDLVRSIAHATDGFYRQVAQESRGDGQRMKLGIGFSTTAKRHRCLMLVLFLLAPVLMILACGNRAPVVVQLMPNSTQTLEPGKSVVISATLSNDDARKGVSWKLIGDGTLVARTATSVMYQAPATIGEGTKDTSVTVTAIANASSGNFASLSIILASPNRAASGQKNQPEKTAEGVQK
jgi:hypothetical protein